MSNVYTTAGSAVYVSASLPATEDQAGYDALPWTLVGGVTAIPELGDTYNLVDFSPFDTRRNISKKGQVDGGSGNLDMARITGDAGQAILTTAHSSDCEISMKVVHNDIPCTGGSTPTVEYRQILVTGRTPTGLGGPDNLDGLSFAVKSNSDTVEVAAA